MSKSGDGRSINHLYYGSGHLHQINIDGTVISDFERDALHREVSRSQGALLQESTWDATGRLRTRASRRKEYSAVQPAELEKRYEYDRADNLIRRLRTSGLRANPWQRTTRATQLHYDAAGRITGCEDGSHRETFAWDAAANLLDTGQLRASVRNNRILSHGDRRYRYDAFGRMAEKRLGDRCTQHFRYDAEQRLCELRVVRPSKSERVCFEYDPLGRRIAKQVFDEVDQPVRRTEFLWDGIRLLSEQTQQLPQRLYIYREPDSYEPLACVDGLNTDQVFYYQNDVSGLPEELTDSAGEVVWEAQFEVWGNTVREHWAQSQRIPQNLRFQGQYLDRETGLHYNTFRYFDPDIGRFTQPDPIGLLGGFNLYQYAPNPVGWVDPWGWAKTPTRTLQKNWETYTGGRHTNPDLHHGFPEELSLDFDRIAGIDVNDPRYYYNLPKESHTKKPGIHTNSSRTGQNWNKTWKGILRRVESMGLSKSQAKSVLERALRTLARKERIGKHSSGAARGCRMRGG